MKKNLWKVWMMTGILAATAAVGGVMAYFTDADEKVNEFTVGSVKIELEEPEWDKKPDEDGDGIPDEAEEILPMQTITKDPRIKNTGDNDAFLFLTVQVPCKNVITVNSDGTRNPKAMTELFSYKTNSSWFALGSTPVRDRDGQQIGKKYLYAYAAADGTCTVVKPQETTSPLFDSITFANLMEGQGVENQPFELPIQAYGIQTSDLNGGTKDAAEIWEIITNQRELTERFTGIKKLGDAPVLEPAEPEIFDTVEPQPTAPAAASLSESAEPVMSASGETGV